MKKQSLNETWSFEVGDGGSLSRVTGEHTTLKTVNLPHDASIEMERNPEEPNGPGNGFFHEDNYIYKKSVFFDESEKEKDIFIEFEGVYCNAFVYVNEAYAGKCPYGYTDFFLNITNYIRFGAENVIKVLVRNGIPSARWYTGGGIYRDVNLMVADKMHFAPEGMRLATVQADEELAVIRVQADIEYHGCGVREIQYCVDIIDAGGNRAATASMPITVTEQSRKSYQQRLYLENPQLWDDTNPVLYRYHAYLKENEQVLDEEEGTFGIRTMQLDPKHGLRINGKKIKLRGGCIHHDNGILGSKEFRHAAERRIAALKAAGYNAIRSAHNPISKRLLDACDRYGIYVIDEYTDSWTSTKVTFDYGVHITEWWEQDLTSLVNKDYNHPSVIMYSIGNEIPETGNKFNAQFGKKLADKIRSMDDTRYVINCMNLLLSGMDMLMQMAGQSQGSQPETGGEINTMMNDYSQMMKMIIKSPQIGQVIAEAAAQVDIVGYNYAAGRYEMDGELCPNRIIVGSETNPGDLDTNWELVEKLPYVIGDFGWAAWDYLGENGIGGVSYGEAGGKMMYAPYPYRAAYCGDINLIGIRRPTSYWREIIWGLRTKPYIAVCPPKHHGEKRNLSQWSMTDSIRSWTWEGYEQQPVTVEVYTLAEEAALYVNGKLIARKKVGEEKKAVVTFEAVYEPGEIRVITYNSGREAESDSIVTANGRILTAEADCTELPADGSDISFVEVSIRDKEGNLNPDGSQQVHISIEGPGEIAGFGSAAPSSEENFFDRVAATYEGRLLAAIRATGEGSITVILTTDGGEEARVMIRAV
ncbi:glycoside hydrolase family 2 TIM barrel-domain containing protein [Clostridium sp. C105KSO13]|uniref:glycoside hydrolase family 2 TIM barrel-domain containing protein n=1 Tax=Clostridium sp. C105KSO13 TaxID=1776045 RepID=UPI00074063D2|nr:glycoside hydrolase family 2 TIM barrel-domain containing protein [Clostridium sp. C105KSO13]CUX25155.1 Beta-galactosidase [Clostridium sp. C105KSO13]